MHPAPRLLALSLAALACDGGGPSGPAPRGAPLYACAVCPADQARVPDGRGETVCVPVGASAAPTPDDPRALLPDLPAPLRYVAPGAAADGDGTRARPFPTVERALAAGATGTLVLLAGRHALAATLAPRGPLALVGAGTALTTIVAPPGGAAVVASSPAVALTLARLAVEGAAPAVEVREGASAALRDVRVTGAGLVVRGAMSSARAEGLTVEDARADCVLVEDGAALALRGSALRRCGGYGVRARAVSAGAEGGRVSAARVLVDGARGYGVGLAGDVTAGGGGPCADGAALPGARSCLRELSVRGVVGVGLGVSGRREVGVWRAHVCGTRAEAGVATGDGVYVAAGARASLDDDLPEHASSLGRGSWVVANARAGVLVERARPDAPDAAETVLTLRGAVVGSNGGPGVVLQRGATARAIDHARVEDNGGLGLGLTPGTRVDQILCDQFVGTRPATLQTTEGPFQVADGLSMSGASAGRVDDNVLSGNARFGAVFGDAEAVLTGNRGDGNLYGVGNYAPTGRVRIDAPAAIAGRAPAPTARPPLVSGAM